MDLDRTTVIRNWIIVIGLGMLVMHLAPANGAHGTPTEHKCLIGMDYERC